MSVPLLEIDGLVRHYRQPRESLFRPAGQVRALNGVSLTLQAGHSLGIVGESGSGKSTLARTVMALEVPTAGSVRLLGQDLFSLSPRQLRAARANFQMVFQDPFGSLDPRQRVAAIVAEPLGEIGGMSAAEQGARVAQTIEAVGLRPADIDKYPHEFSGGQRQRIAIARALITRPRLIVADEPVSALDVSVQAQVLNLLRDLQQQFGITYLFISHDLAVVNHVCDDVAVMYLGRIVEQGAPGTLFSAAAHPYTQALLAAMPRPQPPEDGRRRASRLAMAAASQQHVAGGCPFADRCPHRQDRCLTGGEPPLREIAPGHLAACHFAERLSTLGGGHRESADIPTVAAVSTAI